MNQLQLDRYLLILFSENVYKKIPSNLILKKRNNMNTVLFKEYLMNMKKAL